MELNKVIKILKEDLFDITFLPIFCSPKTEAHKGNK